MYYESGNNDAVIIDKRGYDYYTVIESEHPYQSGMPVDGVQHVILSETVDGGEECIAWNLHFDFQTETYFTDGFYIYDNNVNRNVIFYAGTDWPGTTLPSLRIASSSFYVEFIGPSSTQYPPASYSMGLYGVKLYCAPVYSNTNSETILIKNNALTR